MLISLNWIKDFVKLPNIDADDLANTFTMTTAEVEDVKTTLSHLKGIRVAEIKSITPHPEADKLNLVTFDFGGKTTKEVVCGAPNVKVGLKVPYAELGVTLPNGLTLEPKKIRGILSEGMLCSETELGIGNGSSGLMELPNSAVNGTTMLEYLSLESDIILDVDNKSLTHRPDLWGHYGIAREFAASYSEELKKPFDEAWVKGLEAKFTSDKSPITPKVDKDSAGLAYFGLSLDNVKVGESPSWMKNRLEAVGLRSINNIVDISNYVMLELGMPLHIFDREEIKNNTIHIKRVGSEETFVTLDEMERKLIPSDTVISDSEKPLVIGGLMGGLNSGVKDSTTKIFIEVANWKADEVRRTSTRLGLRTDSSQRYEKSLDSKQCYRTLLRTLELVLKLCPEAKVVGRPEYDGDDLSKIEELTIKTSVDKIKSVLGYPLTEEKLLSIFHSLDFKTKKNGEKLLVTLPTFRTTKDISMEADLIEEVGRMIGYDNIAEVAPLFEVKATRFTNENTLKRKIQDFMTLSGKSLEVMTYPLIGKKLLEKVSWPELNEELVLVNSLSVDADRMRPSLIPHALNTVSVNAKNYDKFSFFEVGRSYLFDKKNFSQERTQVLIGMYDKSRTPFLELLNVVENLLNYLNIPMDFQTDSGKFENALVPKSWNGVHPHEFTNIRIMGRFMGAVNTVHPLVMRNFKVKGNFSFAVIDLADIESKEMKERTKYTALSKFPASHFDCTVVVKGDEPAANVLEALKKVKIKEITDRKINSVFTLNENERAVTVTVKLEDPEKTLSGEVLKEAENSIVKTLADCGYPLKM